MNTIQKHRAHISKHLVISTIVAMCAFTVVVGVTRPVAASPLPVLFADASDCTLPDGNQGKLANYSHTDNKTCCPANAVNVNGEADSVSCFYGKYLNPLIALLAAIVGVVVVVGIIFGAIQYITSDGDPQRAAAGRKRIVNALIGLAAFLLLYAFLQFIVPGGVLNAH